MKKISKNVWAASLVTSLAASAAFSFFALAISDGESHRKEAPLAAFLGKKSYESLRDGESTSQHYLSKDGRVLLRAPDFSLVDQYGKSWKLSDHRGKVIVMNFWTITCRPCVEEMPSIVELAQIAKGKPGIEIVSITIDDSWADVSSLFPQDNALRVLFDPGKKVVRDMFGTRLFPETWIIDAEGIVRLRVDGAREWSSALALSVIESFR